MYARQQNGQVQVGLPKTGKLSDGRTVSNYHSLPADTLAAEGWLPYVDERPEEPEGYYARGTGYDVQASQIVRLYEIVEASPPEPDEIELLQQAVADLAELVLEV